MREGLQPEQTIRSFSIGTRTTATVRINACSRSMFAFLRNPLPTLALQVALATFLLGGGVRAGDPPTTPRPDIAHNSELSATEVVITTGFSFSGTMTWYEVQFGPANGDQTLTRVTDGEDGVDFSVDSQPFANPGSKLTGLTPGTAYTYKVRLESHAYGINGEDYGTNGISEWGSLTFTTLYECASVENTADFCPSGFVRPPPSDPSPAILQSVKTWLMLPGSSPKTHCHLFVG